MAKSLPFVINVHVVGVEVNGPSVSRLDSQFVIVAGTMGEGSNRQPLQWVYRSS